MAIEYIVLEADGTSKITLEDSTGSILLETSDAPSSGSGGFSSPAGAVDSIQELDL